MVLTLCEPQAGSLAELRAQLTVRGGPTVELRRSQCVLPPHQEESSLKAEQDGRLWQPAISSKAGHSTRVSSQDEARSRRWEKSTLGQVATVGPSVQRRGSLPSATCQSVAIAQVESSLPGSKPGSTLDQLGDLEQVT